LWGGGGPVQGTGGLGSKKGGVRIAAPFIKPFKMKNISYLLFFFFFFFFLMIIKLSNSLSKSRICPFS
jgi:hypothetical protein